MKITIDGKHYGIALEKTALAESIAAMCPITLNMSRSGSHEYYAPLPQRAKTDGAPATSQVKRGGVYYFAPWNAFSLVFADMEIAPYKVSIVGQAEEALAASLEQTGGQLNITIEE